MNENSQKRFDCLIDELVRLKEQEKAGVLLVPKRTQQLSERLVNLFIAECEVALRPMLRDMIGRGQALESIKAHFDVGVKKNDTD